MLDGRRAKVFGRGWTDQFFVAAPTVGIRAVEKIDADLTRGAGVEKRLQFNSVYSAEHSIPLIRGHM